MKKIKLSSDKFRKLIREYSESELDKLRQQMKANREAIMRDYKLSSTEMSKLATVMSTAAWERAKGGKYEYETFGSKPDPAIPTLIDKGFLVEIKPNKLYKLTSKTEKLAPYILGGEQAYKK